MSARWITIACAVLVLACGSARAADNDAVLKVTVDKSTPKVGERVVMTIRGDYDLTVADDVLKVPQLKGVDWLQLHRDSWSNQTVAGRQIRVFERRLALFANKPGRLTIPALVHHLTVIDDNGQRTERQVTSQPVMLDVSPAPVAAGTPWLPATSVTLTDRWSHDPAKLKKGAIVRRTVVLKAVGADPLRLPAEPSMREPWLIVFPDPAKREVKRTPNGPVITITWSWQLRPITGEIGTLPAITVPWYDTRSGKMHDAVIGPRRIGYAGFGADTRAGWRRDFQSPTTLLVSALLGFCLTLSATFLYVRPRRVADMAAHVRRLIALLPDRHSLALRLAVLRRDAAALRRAAHAYLLRRTQRHQDREALALLDRHLFSSGSDAAPFDFHSFGRVVLAARWRT